MDYYSRGFFDKCAAYGVDPRAIWNNGIVPTVGRIKNTLSRSMPHGMVGKAKGSVMSGFRDFKRARLIGVPLLAAPVAYGLMTD